MDGFFDNIYLTRLMVVVAVVPDAADDNVLDTGKKLFVIHESVARAGCQTSCRTPLTVIH